MGVSAFVCEYDVYKIIVLCDFFFRGNSMVYFLIAFGLMCLQDSGVASRAVIATLFGIFSILTFWCICTPWRKQVPSYADKPQRTILTFEEDSAKRKEKGFKFTREDSDTTKSQPTKLPALRTTFKAPFKKLRRDNSNMGEKEMPMSNI